jgi:hypothetical protein
MTTIKNSLSSIFKAHDNDTVDKNQPLLKNTKGVLMCITGKKRTGKTSLWLSMLSNKKLYGGYFGNIWLISPSSSDEKTKPLVNELDKEGKFFKELTENNINSILAYIKEEQSRQKQHDKKVGKKSPPIYNLLILDDVITDIPRSFKKNIITSLFYNQRHYNLSIIVISQSYKLLQANIRKNIDMLYCFPMTNLKEKEALQDDWSIPDEIFDIAFGNEEDHPFLTINLTGSKPVFFRKFDKINHK